jgi:hypothetical protein
MRALASFALLCLLLAGCVSTTPTSPTGPGGAGTPHASLGGWALDCTLGAASRAANASDPSAASRRARTAWAAAWSWPTT